jgi:hypothetical protein
MSAPGRDPLLSRLERDAVIVAAVLAVAAAALWPGRPGRALGVLGGFALIAVSYRGIRAGVDGLWAGASGLAEAGGAIAPPPKPSRAGFVKFFTRHAILAGGAYVMMAMLAGVTAPAVAATVEFVRTVRARDSGPHSRSS